MRIRPRALESGLAIAIEVRLEFLERVAVEDVRRGIGAIEGEHADAVVEEFRVGCLA